MTKLLELSEERFAPRIEIVAESNPNYELRPTELPQMNNSHKIRDFFMPRIGARRREAFVVAHLTTKLRCTSWEIVTSGTLNQSVVHPREVFQAAILAEAYAIVCVHNHPSGDPRPSREDLAITRKLRNAGDVIGIRVLEHVILGHNAHYSMADNGDI